MITSMTLIRKACYIWLCLMCPPDAEGWGIDIETDTQFR